MLFCIPTVRYNKWLFELLLPSCQPPITLIYTDKLLVTGLRLTSKVASITCLPHSELDLVQVVQMPKCIELLPRYRLV